MDLRQRIRRKMKNRFDLKAFHDEFLSYGTIPVPLIAQCMVSRPIEGIQPSACHMAA